MFRSTWPAGSAHEDVSDLVELLNEHTPLVPPFGGLVLVTALFLCAWLVSRAAGRIAAAVVTRAERRRSVSLEDTGVIASLKHRETAISMARTAVAFVAYGLAGFLALGVAVGADRLGTLVGASFLVVLLAFGAQRFLLDVIAGLLMFQEGWFRIGDTVVIEPWAVLGVVEDMTLRGVTVRSPTGEVMRVANSEVKAVRVLPRGYRKAAVELFVDDERVGRELVEHVARIVPTGPTHFIRRPSVAEVDPLDDDLVRVRVDAAVPLGREWLAEELLPSLLRERADEGTIVHGPVVMWVDEQAERRFARALRTPHRVGGDEPRMTDWPHAAR